MSQCFNQFAPFLPSLVWAYGPQAPLPTDEKKRKKRIKRELSPCPFTSRRTDESFSGITGQAKQIMRTLISVTQVAFRGWAYVFGTHFVPGRKNYTYILGARPTEREQINFEWNKCTIACAWRRVRVKKCRSQCLDPVEVACNAFSLLVQVSSSVLWNIFATHTVHS